MDNVNTEAPARPRTSSTVNARRTIAVAFISMLLMGLCASILPSSAGVTVQSESEEGGCDPEPCTTTTTEPCTCDVGGPAAAPEEQMQTQAAIVEPVDPPAAAPKCKFSITDSERYDVTDPATGITTEYWRVKVKAECGDQTKEKWISGLRTVPGHLPCIVGDPPELQNCPVS
jgi:hypothetical protein